MAEPGLDQGLSPFFFKKSRLVELAACTNLQYHTPALNRLCIAELRFMVLLGLCSSAS